MTWPPLSDNSGTIIFLNGPSAVGKSSLQKALQATLEEPYLKVGIDSFFDALIPAPDLSQFAETHSLVQTAPNGELIRSITLEKDGQGNQLVPLKIGPIGEKIIHGMHHALAAYADQGNNLIVDYILYNPEWIYSIVNALQGRKVYFIGLHAPIDVLEERERQRATSPLGHARSHYLTVHEGMEYDMEFNLTKLSSQDCALLIKEFIYTHPTSQALSRLACKFI